MLLMPRGRAVPVLILAALVGAAVPAAAQDAAKGATLLNQARAALGGADKLAAITRLQLSGEFKRAQGNNTQEGDFEIQIEAPDKYKLTEDTGTAGGPTSERVQALNGTEIWDANDTGGFPGGGRGGRGFRGGFGGDRGGGGGDRGGFGGRRGGGDAGADGQAAAGAQGRGQFDPERVRDLQRRQRQTDLDHLLLVTLLSSSAPVTWIGTAQSPDGMADVLEFKPQDGQATRLFLDQTSHMPLMITWEGAARGGGGRGRFGRRGGNAGARGADAEARGGDAAAGAAPAGAAPAAPQATTLEMHLSNYKTENGLKLPHFISRGANGQTQEELTIKSYKLNPNFKSNTFIQPK